MKGAVALVALLLPACSDGGLVPHPPPITVAIALRPGQEVVCIESRVRLELPILAPLISWARREWRCQLINEWHPRMVSSR